MTYKATRSFWYQPEGGGPERFVVEGETVTDASEGKIAALLLDGLIVEAPASSKE